jgi:hypothetical protein
MASRDWKGLILGMSNLHCNQNLNFYLPMFCVYYCLIVQESKSIITQPLMRLCA